MFKVIRLLLLNAFILILILLPLYTEAQAMIIYLKDGKTIRIDTNNIEKIVFEKGKLIYSKIFNNTEGWEVVGRRKGTNKVEITNFKGLVSVHLYHQSFTEIGIEKIFDLSRYIEIPRDLVIEIKMAGSVRSFAGETSDFYSKAGVTVALLEDSEEIIYRTSKAWSTSTYPLKHLKYLEVLKTPQKTWTTVKIEIPSKYVANSRFLKVTFSVYASGWPDDLIANLWVHSINIYTR